jgi:error-prone DNA polymerase
MASSPYIELHAHSAFSFLDGASLPIELAGSAARFGYEAIALTDHDGVWGSMEFAVACAGLGVRAISGAELSVSTGGGPEPSHVTLLVEDAGGWRNLCRLLTLAHSHTRRGKARELGRPWVTIEQLEDHTAGLVCLTGCATDGLLGGAFASRPSHSDAVDAARRLRDAFGRRSLYIELQRPFADQDRARNRWLVGVAERLGVPVIATGNVHSHDARRAYLQDVLVAIRLNMSLEATEPRRRGNHSSALASPQEMARRFADHHDAVAETVKLADRLQFSPTSDLGYAYPGSSDPSASRKLAEICLARLDDRYAVSGGRRRREAEARLEQELQLIDRLHLSGFFILHADLVDLARQVAGEVRGPDGAKALLPPARGRGSSVSSIVCFLAGLSHIDPIEAGLDLGRFLNEEVGAETRSMPDIDIDLPRDVRDRLIPKIHEVYGNEHSALVAAFPTYMSKGAVRDLGKALSLPAEEINLASKAFGYHGDADEIESQLEAALGKRRAGEHRWRMLARLAPEIMGLPRHASQHSGGMVISTEPLINVCPIVPTAMEARQIVMWDKDSCADAGLLKVDLLGLGMLSAVERTITAIEEARGERLDLTRIPLKDPATYRSIQRAETTGVFQIESRAQQQMLVRTRPEHLEDLTVQVALVRPGPIQGGAIHPYIERRTKLREDPSYEVPYDHELMRRALEETLGTIVFQEQVLAVAKSLAGFTTAEAEGLRRAMSRKRSQAAITAYYERFIAGAEERGVPTKIAERAWNQVKGFSGFGFPKAHSAAFGLLAYQTAYLREHYGPEFLVGLLNEQPMGFYPPHALVEEARRRDFTVLAPDVNRSRVLCNVEAPNLEVRIGLGYVKGIREESMNALVDERERTGSYASVADLASRSGVDRDGLERLAWAGALDGLMPATAAARNDDRRGAYWQLGVVGARPPAPRAQMSMPLEPPSTPGTIEELDSWQTMIADYQSTGISLGAHPMGLLRDSLGPKVLRSDRLSGHRDGTTVEVAGMVTARQRPESAKGVTFITLEDESGVANLIVGKSVYEKARMAVRSAPLLWAKGKLEHRAGPVNIVVTELRPLQPVVAAESATGPTPPTSLDERRKRDRREQALAELRAAAPGGHSFGRRR